MDRSRGLWRSRWAAVGAAVAVTLGAGGLITVRADSAASVFVAVTPTRLLDTRIDVGLVDAFVSGTGRVLDVTGTVPVVLPSGSAGTGAPIPDGATAIVANVTAVFPTSAGFVAVRPGNATGTPTTSSINFTSSGTVSPNSVTVELAAAGTVELFFQGAVAGATTDLLVDIVGYYVAGGGGTPGPKGDPGDPGPQGLSAWDTIPSGVTVTGAFVHDAGSDGTGEDYWFTVEYPAKLPAAPIAVNFATDGSAATTDDDATCAGTTSTPTAPPGQVCVYLDQTAGTASLNAESLGISIRSAMVLTWNVSAASGDMNVWGTWAYTAP